MIPSNINTISFGHDIKIGKPLMNKLFGLDRMTWKSKSILPNETAFCTNSETVTELLRGDLRLSTNRCPSRVFRYSKNEAVLFLVTIFPNLK